MWIPAFFDGDIPDKSLLSWILKGCVSEYKNCTPGEIEQKYIEGDPKISAVGVDHGGLIYGLDTVDKDRDEHTILYDILFYATLPDSEEKIGLFINVEAQNRYNPGYPLVKRGIYYCSRLIAAQFNRDFADGKYEGLKKVYSIWLCTDAPDARKNTITQYEMTEKYLLGEAKEERVHYDMLSVIMVCFNKRNILQEIGENDDPDAAKLVHLLNVLLSSQVEWDDKKQIMKEEYHIRMTRELEMGVSQMCNLSRGIREEGISIGIVKGREEGISIGVMNKAAQMAVKMLQKNKPASEILEFTELTLAQLRDLAAQNNLPLIDDLKS